MSQIASVAKKTVALSLLVSLLSCSQGKIDPFDRTTGLSQSEIRDGLIKDQKKSKSKNLEKNSQEKNSNIPNVSKLMVTPPPPQIGGDKIISFSVTEQVPLKDVLIELGRLTKIDVDLDPKISGGIILNAKNRPFKEVLDRIATLGKLRYTYENDVLYFQPDKPYMKNYFVDYLQGGTLWTDVESNIKNILSPGGGSGGNSGKSGSSSGSTTNSTAAASTSGTSASNQTSTSSSAKSSTGSSGSTASPGNTSGTISGSGSFVSPNSSSFSSNKSAGIISISATSKEHDTIEKYLSDVEKHSSAQVLIEAKVIEVTLSDAYKTGINWSSIGKKNSITANNANTYASGTPLTYVATEIFNSDITSSITALETFGSTRAISSPRISAMNNQKATLDFSEKFVYFTISTSTSTVASGTSGATTVSGVTATKVEVPIGVQISITPSINLLTNEVTLNIEPKLSVNSGRKVDDPSVNPNTGESLGNKIPIILTRELNTISKVQSGNILVIGGLMSDTTSNIDTGIPFIAKIPVLGWLFKSVSKSSDVVETVILIKATIVKSGTPARKTDREFEKFDSSKRRFFEQK